MSPRAAAVWLTDMFLIAFEQKWSSATKFDKYKNVENHQISPLTSFQ